MAENTKTAAIFDLDGTLFTGHFWHGIVKYHVNHRIKLPSVAFYIITHLPLWAASKLKITGEETYKVKWGEDLAALFRGLSAEEMIKIYEWAVDNYVMKLLRTDILALVQLHKKEGHATFILSTSFNDFLEIIKQRLDIDHVVGTKIEMVNNVCSGRIVKPLCLGMNKARLLQEFISQAKLNIDLASSVAYADSYSDIPILEMVGNPVATYPDQKLLNFARSRCWQILPAPAG
jgi:HAD superfamily hydrolase (TIGR01490 family)